MTVWYTYDAFGQLAAAYEQRTSGEARQYCTTCYVFSDHLGSTRALWDATGVRARFDYFPYGEPIGVDRNNRTSAACAAGVTNCFGSSGDLKLKFTGKERDAEIGLDYFGARYMSSAQGRFTSPDEQLLDQDESDPQSWNLYSYVRNNPLVNVDPWGQDCVYTYGATQCDTSVLVGIERGKCSSSAGTYIAGTIDTSSLTLKNGKVGFSYKPDSGADFGTGSITLPQLEYPGIQGQANYFGAQRIVNGAGPVVNTLGAVTMGFVGGATVAGAMSGTSATEGIMSQTAGYLGKSSARALAARLATSAAQAAAAASAISRATSSSSVQVFRQGTNLVVRIVRAGANGYHAVESVIDQAGNKQVVQKAYDMGGSLVHYDPKN